MGFPSASLKVIEMSVLSIRKNTPLARVTALFALGLVVACSAEVRPSGPPAGDNSPDLSKPGIAMNLNAGLDIPANDIPSLEESALGGSGGSALRLALFHRFIRHDWAQYSYWITISAENNDPAGTYDLAYLLVYGRDVKPRKDRKNAIRARFWLPRSAEQGCEEAKEVLKEPGKWSL